MLQDYWTETIHKKRIRIDRSNRKQTPKARPYAETHGPPILGYGCSKIRRSSIFAPVLRSPTLRNSLTKIIHPWGGISLPRMLGPNIRRSFRSGRTNFWCTFFFFFLRFPLTKRGPPHVSELSVVVGVSRMHAHHNNHTTATTDCKQNQNQNQSHTPKPHTRRTMEPASSVCRRQSS